MFLPQRLFSLTDSVMGSRVAVTAFKKHPKIAGNIVIIQHRLYAKYWNNKTADLLRAYATFWSKAANEVDRPLILIFFNVIFDSATPVTAPAEALLRLRRLSDRWG